MNHETTTTIRIADAASGTRLIDRAGNEWERLASGAILRASVMGLTRAVPWRADQLNLLERMFGPFYVAP